MESKKVYDADGNWVGVEQTFTVPKGWFYDKWKELMEQSLTVSEISKWPEDDKKLEKLMGRTIERGTSYCPYCGAHNFEQDESFEPGALMILREYFESLHSQLTKKEMEVVGKDVVAWLKLRRK
jgi:hypothetical protein